jgi:hypothetical protein
VMGMKHRRAAQSMAHSGKRCPAGTRKKSKLINKRWHKVCSKSKYMRRTGKHIIFSGGETEAVLEGGRRRRSRSRSRSRSRRH